MSVCSRKLTGDFPLYSDMTDFIDYADAINADWTMEKLTGPKQSFNDNMYSNSGPPPPLGGAITTHYCYCY